MVSLLKQMSISFIFYFFFPFSFSLRKNEKKEQSPLLSDFTSSKYHNRSKMLQTEASWPESSMYFTKLKCGGEDHYLCLKKL